jgi:AcrR family transcriptional regulator
MASREILDSALRLFTEQGYDETPIAQIAREAGVSERTLFRYFGTKQDLLGDDQNRFGRVMAETVGQQPAEADVWDVLRAAVAAALALHDTQGQALQRFRLLHRTASLRAGWLDKRLRFQQELLPLIAERMGIAPGGVDPRARAVIATVFACLDAASAAWVESDGAADIMDLYDECVTAVRG